MNTGLTVRVWNDAAIARRDEDGYANATTMCQANGKRWHEYNSNQRTQEYIQALAASLDLTPADLVITTTTGPNEFRGTWIHPRLAVDLARWISPEFAVWMDGWFLESLQQARPLPFDEEDLTEGVKVFATSERDAVDIWRQTLHKQLIGLVNRQFGTQGIPEYCQPPVLPYCRYVNINPRFSREALTKAINGDCGITSHDVLARLGQPITRANEMYVSAALRDMGYTKTRTSINGTRFYVFCPPAR